MVNYYAELGLDRGLSIEELEKELKALKRKWTTRASSAADTERRQAAERMVALIREASATLLNKENRAKYDKSLDKDPAASAQTAPTPAYEAPAPEPNAAMDLSDLVEQFYDDGNYKQAIAVAEKAIRSGAASLDIYRLAALCHVECGNNTSAYRTLVSMKDAFPNDATAKYVFALFCIRLLPDHAAEGHAVVAEMLQNGFEDDNDINALDAEYSLMTGDVALAEKKITAYLAEHDEREYREAVCRAYATYADTFLTNYGGDNYFNSQEDCDNWFKHMERALEIYPDPDYKKLHDDNKAIVGGKTFLSDNWLGILCAAIYTIGGFSANIFIGILLLAVTVAEVYYSIVPKWMLHRYNYTNRLVGIYEVFRIINYVLSVIVRIGWEITKFIFRLIFSFI